MGIAVKCNAVRPQRNHLFDRLSDGRQGLVRQAKDQVKRNRRISQGTALSCYPFDIFKWLYSVDRPLDLVIQILNAEAHAPETEGMQYFEVRLSGVVWVAFKAEFVIRVNVGTFQ